MLQSKINACSHAQSDADNLLFTVNVHIGKNEWVGCVGVGAFADFPDCRSEV